MLNSISHLLAVQYQESPSEPDPRSPQSATEASPSSGTKKTPRPLHPLPFTTFGPGGSSLWSHCTKPAEETMAVRDCSAKLVAEEKNTKPNETNGAFHVSLQRLPSGDYQLNLFMKLRFFFFEGKGGDWTETEKRKYMRDWQEHIQSVWGQVTLFTLKDGKQVKLELGFEIQEAGNMWAHWNVNVEKTPARKVAPSKTDVKYLGLLGIRWYLGDVYLNSEDFTPFPDKDPSHFLSNAIVTLLRGKPEAITQRGAVHEFGHMLGIPDDYLQDSLHRHDLKSVMNGGEEIRPRHLEFFRSWVLKNFPGIKNIIKED